MAASYPTAVKSFTVKSDGDTIQPSHINDLQDEVAAIEAGLLNGTAPLNSSNSTVANLSVTGASTLASLQVTGNCTIVGTLTVGAVVSTATLLPTQTSFARARITAVVPLTSAASWSTLLWQNKLADVSSELSTTTGYFTAKSSGTYLVEARIYMPTHLGWTILSLGHSGVEVSRVTSYDLSAVELGMNNAIVMNCDSGATFYVNVYHAGGSTVSVSTNTLTEFSVTKLF